MIVVESGGTKSTWIYRDAEGEKKKHVTVGLHPQELTIAKKAAIEEFLIDEDLHGRAVYFYGAGCESEAGKQSINELLTNADLKVKRIASDVVCACMAVLGDQSGVVGILGTGAVVAQYDGSKVIKMASGRGFILGDEGSGFDIGRRITVAYLDDRFADNPQIEQTIVSHYGGANKVVHACSAPDSRFKIAALTEKIAAFRDDQIVNEVLSACFSDFIDRGIALLDHQNEIGMVGSIAYYFKDELSNVLTDRGIRLNQVFKEVAEACYSFVEENNDFI